MVLGVDQIAFYIVYNQIVCTLTIIFVTLCYDIINPYLKPLLFQKITICYMLAIHCNTDTLALIIR